MTAANLLAVAAVEAGKYAQSFPFFGVERRGAPVQAFCRIADEPIRIHQNVYKPDHIVVLDASLMKDVDVTEGLKEDGCVIVNCKGKCPVDVKYKTYTVDASEIALRVTGKPFVNTVMLGAVAKATGLVKPENFEPALKERFPGKVADVSMKAIKECYENTKC